MRTEKDTHGNLFIDLSHDDLKALVNATEEAPGIVGLTPHGEQILIRAPGFGEARQWPRFDGTLPRHIIEGL